MMLKIAFCASLYNKVEDFNILAELISRHKREYAERWQIDLFACSTAEDAESVTASMKGFDHLVKYAQPSFYDGEKRDYAITRKVFHCIRQMLNAAFEAGYDFAIFVHSDVYPLDFGNLAAIIETMRGEQYLVAARGDVSVKAGTWMDDNIMFFDLKIASRYPGIFTVDSDNDLTKPLFDFGIHHLLPFWLMRYLTPQDFYFFSDCSKNVGFDGRPQGAHATPLNYDPDLKILHADSFGWWGSTSEAPVISAAKQRIFRENGYRGETGSETERFLSTKFKFENPALRRIKNRVRPFLRRGAAAP